MKIERFIFGMYDGKITLLETSGLAKILSDQNFKFLRNLTVQDSDKPLWLKTEQLIAYPHITETTDKYGRTFTQNETLLIPMWDYIKLTNPAKLFQNSLKNRTQAPDSLEPLEIGES